MMTGVKRTAMSVVVDDVASLSRGVVKGAIRGVVPWTTVALTVLPVALIPLLLYQTMKRWTTTTTNPREVFARGG
jgi:hypothetical protein